MDEKQKRAKAANTEVRGIFMFNLGEFLEELHTSIAGRANYSNNRSQISITAPTHVYRIAKNRSITIFISEAPRAQVVSKTKDMFKDKIIAVAASSAGLGFGIAEAVAKQGGSVSLASRTKENIEKAAQSLSEAHDIKAVGYVMDATDPGSITSWIDNTLDAFGRIDGLVVNAGGPPPGKFDDFSDTDWEKGFNLTLMSAVRMIRAVLPRMRDQGSGSIVTITSSSIKEPIDILLLSNVFRSGVVSLVKSLSTDLAKEGIRINNLVPGQIDTDRVRSNDVFKSNKLGLELEDWQKKRHAMIPMGRYGTIQEFGEVGAFLLSDSARYITGSTLFVDGGKSKTVW